MSPARKIILLMTRYRWLHHAINFIPSVAIVKETNPVSVRLRSHLAAHTLLPFSFVPTGAVDFTHVPTWVGARVRAICRTYAPLAPSSIIVAFKLGPPQYANYMGPLWVLATNYQAGPSSDPATASCRIQMLVRRALYLPFVVLRCVTFSSPIPHEGGSEIDKLGRERTKIDLITSSPTHGRVRVKVDKCMSYTSSRVCGSTDHNYYEPLRLSAVHGTGKGKYSSGDITSRLPFQKVLFCFIYGLGRLGASPTSTRENWVSIGIIFTRSFPVGFSEVFATVNQLIDEALPRRCARTCFAIGLLSSSEEERRPSRCGIAWLLAICKWHGCCVPKVPKAATPYVELSRITGSAIPSAENGFLGGSRAADGGATITLTQKTSNEPLFEWKRSDTYGIESPWRSTKFNVNSGKANLSREMLAAIKMFKIGIRGNHVETHTYLPEERKGCLAQEIGGQVPSVKKPVLDNVSSPSHFFGAMKAGTGPWVLLGLIRGNRYNLKLAAATTPSTTHLVERKSSVWLDRDGEKPSDKE
ncbi:hypothetical protein EDC04DRAFT_3097746 [Pisolithus marmoratus]|nr:hypothetical protein EDC04DRAFT_3097746 [Pisolithus marmoratus]